VLAGKSRCADDPAPDCVDANEYGEMGLSVLLLVVDVGTDSKGIELGVDGAAGAELNSSDALRAKDTE
jgi:hypothetical protein